MRQKVEFSANVPTQVILDGIGFEQAGKNGPEYRYFLEDDKIMWVPPAVHAELTAAGVNTGSLVQITKIKEGKAAATWRVEIPRQARNYGYGQASPTNPPPADDFERRPNQGWVNRGPAQPPAGPRTQPQPAAALASGTPAYEMDLSPVDRMAAALADAITLWAEAMQRAAEAGIDARPNAEDIRATAATLFIAGGAR